MSAITPEQCERDCAQYRGPCFAEGCPRALALGLMTPGEVMEDAVRRLREGAATMRATDNPHPITVAELS